MPSLEVLYLVASVCLLAITALLIALGIQLMQVLRDLGRISGNIEQMTALLERVALAVFPGMERAAKKAASVERKVEAYIEKKFKL